MEENVDIDTFCRFTQVSRETIYDLKKIEKLILNSNKEFNLIGKSTIDKIWNRHFLDSAQIIDFIDKNCQTLCDLGSGAGFPGLILSAIAKDRKMPLKIKLVEKSPKKSKFLRKLINEFNLDAEVINQNILNNKENIITDVFVARAFKPLGVILEFMHRKSIKWKKIFIFLGKTGKNELFQVSKIWDIQYKQRVSITSNDSIVIEINYLEKK